MNVLFLIPPSPDHRRIVRMIDCSFETKAAYLWQPNDYLIISSLLAQADEATLIDGTAARMEEAEFSRQVGVQTPDIIFFALSSTCWDWDYRLFTSVRQQFPATPLYLIGDLFLEDDYLEHVLPLCEGVVYIPYMLDLASMVSHSRRGNTSLPGLRRPGMRRDREAKQTIPVTAGIPRHELFLNRGYSFPFARHFAFTTVTTMWGCPFSCFYCNQNSIPPTVRPWQEVAAELARVEQLGVKELFFADKSFGYPPRAINLLLDAMAKHSFSWSCYFHPQMYRPKLLEKMHAAGCHTLIVGIDSANLSQLRQYQRHVEPSKIKQLIDHANHLGMDICADFIIGLEHENEEDIRASIAYALSLPVDFTSFNIAAPLPGSGIREKAVANGNLVFGQEGFDTLARSGVVVNSGLSQSRILKLRRQAIRRFYLRPGYLIRRLRKTKSFEHFRIQWQQMVAMFGKA